jgi:CRISPR-associated protein Csy3
MSAMDSKNIDKGIEPISVVTETIRGTISNHVKDVAAQLEKDEKSPNNPNIQAIEVARLPVGKDVLILSGEINVLPYFRTPSTCNSDAYVENHHAFIEAFIEKGGIDLLSERYFMNFINGSILWRNRYGADVNTTVAAKDFSHTFFLAEMDLSKNLSISALKAEDKKAGKRFVKMIAKQFSGKLEDHQSLHFEITAKSTLGYGQDVYPSQDFPNEAAAGKTKKILAKLQLSDSKNQAYMHSQKIGNAIRTIDNWFEDAVRPIAVEPYGVDQSLQKALRAGKKTNFYYSLAHLDDLTEDLRNDKTPSNESLFVAACFIRGGVFSKKK